MSASEKLIHARAALVLEEPFFGALVLSLALTEDASCATAWVNGREIGYNPSFVNSLTHEQLKGLLAHEVMHCASGHPWRRDGRDMKRWNLACDRAINNVLVDAGFKLPENACYATGEEIGKSAEWICNRLPDNPQSNGEEKQDEPGDAGDTGDDSAPGDEPGDDSSEPGDGNEPGDAGDELGEVRDAPGDEETPTEEDWQQAVQQAAIQANAMGNLSAGLARFAKQSVKPQVDWKSILRRFVQTYATADYSWQTPNSRYLASGMYLPSLKSEQLGEIAVAIDTSGSMDELALAAAKAELEQIIAETSPVRVTVYYADSEIARIDEFTDEPITWNPAGGGGTDFRPVFAHAEAKDVQPVCLIYVTDLEGQFPKDSAIPTLWVSDGKHITPPFGEVVPITD